MDKSPERRSGGGRSLARSPRMGDLAKGIKMASTGDTNTVAGI